jgi:hypothetical protein
MNRILLNPSLAAIIEQGVQKLRIVHDPKIHYDLLRFCQHMRLAFVADVNLTLGAGIGCLALFKDPALFLSQLLIQDSIVQAILQRGLGTTFDTLSAHELAWCRVIVELPHHNFHTIRVGQSLRLCQHRERQLSTAQLLKWFLMVSWLSSLSHASEWVAGQNLADPNTWNISALQTLKQLHNKLLMRYNCTEWAPPLVANAHAPDAPAQERDDNSARPLSLPPLNLLDSLRVRQD